LRALTLLIARQLLHELNSLAPEIDFCVAPPLCPLLNSPSIRRILVKRSRIPPGRSILVGLEASPLSQWLFNGLVEAGSPVVRIETRHEGLPQGAGQQ
jgi:hypothetical protein